MTSQLCFEDLSITDPEFQWLVSPDYKIVDAQLQMSTSILSVSKDIKTQIVLFQIFYCSQEKRFGPKKTSKCTRVNVKWYKQGLGFYLIHNTLILQGSWSCESSQQIVN